MLIIWFQGKCINALDYIRICYYCITKVFQTQEDFGKDSLLFLL
jgi:hypothetical protein